MQSQMEAGAMKKHVRNAYFVDLYVFYDGFDDPAGEGSSGEGVGGEVNLSP